MNDLTKLSRHEQTTAKVLPTIANKLKAAQELIGEARAMAADLVNIDHLRSGLTKSFGETVDARYSLDLLTAKLILKANS